MEKIVHSCVAAMLKYQIIDQKQRAMMIYGLDLLLSSVISLLSFVLLGFLFHVEGPTFWLLLVFIPLQSFGGGYHCQTHFKCWALMVAGYFIAIFLLIKLPAAVLWGGAFLNAYSFLKLAPIEHPKAPFGMAFRQKMRAIVIRLYVVILIFSGIASVFHLKCVSPVLTATILSGFSILCAYMKYK